MPENDKITRVINCDPRFGERKINAFIVVFAFSKTIASNRLACLDSERLGIVFVFVYRD
jgi:hypothetical protein